jgi:hypothetical protein
VTSLTAEGLVGGTLFSASVIVVPEPASLAAALAIAATVVRRRRPVTIAPTPARPACTERRPADWAR